jgi:hypothetical protein
MALVKSIVFIDGENLTIRYQAMRDAGRSPRPDAVHEPDVFVWRRDFATFGIPGIDTDVLRVGYYTSVVGDDNRLAAVQTLMADCSYGVHGAGMRDYYGTCQINPRVFKKAQRSNKSRLVDINITIDVMRHACARDIDVVYLLSGDGDFVELVREASRHGQKVCVGALSSGLEPRMRSVGDRFIDLDDVFFAPLALPGADG